MQDFVLKVVICVLSIYSIISVVVSLSKPNVMDEIGGTENIWPISCAGSPLFWS